MQTGASHDDLDVIRMDGYVILIGCRPAVVVVILMLLRRRDMVLILRCQVAILGVLVIPRDAQDHVRIEVILGVVGVVRRRNRTYRIVLRMVRIVVAWIAVLIITMARITV